MGNIERSVADELDEFADYCRSVAADSVGDQRAIWRERGAWAMALAHRSRGAVDALRRIAAYPLGDPITGREANKIARATLESLDPPRGR